MLWLLLIAIAASSSADTVKPTVQKGWYYNDRREIPCSADELILRPTDEEKQAGRLSAGTHAKAVRFFQACGVVVLEGLVPATRIKEVDQGVRTLLEPLLQSRERVRVALKTMIREGAQKKKRRTFRDLWEDSELKLPQEPLFNAGRQYRERNDGRIDLLLPFEPPFDAQELSQNPLMVELLLTLLGEKAKLKSVNAVVALTAKQGNDDQHWHRDTELLFTNDDATFHLKDTHAHGSGVHLPPYAINAFFPLVDMTPSNGPTEFTLGSHMWGDVWASDEAEGDWEDRRFYVPAGSVILSDYRTVHRGTVNSSPAPRPLIMCVFGRNWWSDRTNYGSEDFGGLSTLGLDGVDPDSPEGRRRSLVAELGGPANPMPRGGSSGGSEEKNEAMLLSAAKYRMFTGFSQKYQRSLFAEIEDENKRAKPRPRKEL